MSGADQEAMVGQEDWMRRARRPAMVAVCATVLLALGWWFGPLVAWIVGWFALLLWAGIRFRHPSGWVWIDPLYYLLAAVGVWLLFDASAAERALNVALTRQVEAQDNLRVVQRRGPILDQRGMLDATIEIGLEDLTKIAREGESCRSLFVAEGGCAAKADEATALKAVSALGAPPSTATDPIARGRYAVAYCTALRGLPARSKAQGIDAELMDQLSSDMRRMERWTRGPVDPGKLARLKTNLRLLGQDRRDHPVLQGEDPTHIFARAHLSQTTDFAVIVLHSYAACLSLPEDFSQSLDDHARWSTEMESAKSVLRDAGAKVAELRRPHDITPFSVFLAWLRMNLWPYFLTAALALKFGKGISALTAQGAKKAV